MAQITTGIRRVLNHPIVYQGFQAALGAGAIYRRLADDFLQLQTGEHLLDIGCGPADILDHIDADIRYTGYDISTEYVEAARARRGSTDVQFVDRVFDASEAASVGQVDVVVLSAVLHHLDDAEAAELVTLVRSCLRPGGRLITLDPCLLPDQRPIARFLAEKDRGQAVRAPDRYRALVAESFVSVDQTVTHDQVRLAGLVPVPYDHCFQVCRV